VSTDVNSVDGTTLDIQRPSPHVAHVWLNRPDVRNAFNDSVIQELTVTFETMSSDPALRVIVLGGHGKAFCAGADLAWMRQMADYNWTQNHADAARLAHMLAVMWACPVPIVGRVHGDCYAGGLGLAAVCDVLVAADNVQFCLSEAKLGLLPATIAPYVIRAMGEQAARRYFVTAERFSATQALAMGFVHEVVPGDPDHKALDAGVNQIVQAIVDNGPAAVKACKQLVKDVGGQSITAALRDDTAQRIANTRASAEGRAGVQAFLDKRPAPWRA
jgi:methylglutaconyl-CoA hydratase